MKNIRVVGRQIKDAFILKAIPVLFAVLVYFLGAPWYVAVLILLSAQYWYGPIVVYFTQRMPTLPSLNSFDPNASLPTAHEDFFQKTLPILEGAGFRALGRFECVDERQGIRATGALFQHPETSDLAHLLVATQEGQTEAGETLSFSRARIDGSRIGTIRNTVQSPFPPNPNDSELRVDGSIDALDLWRVHQARVAADINAKRNETISDGLRFQMDLEKEEVRKHIESGLWQEDEFPQFIRPTGRGALLMCLRMLTPWKQMARISARIQTRHLLRKYKGT